MKRRDFLAAASLGAVAAPALLGMSRKAGRALAGGFVDDGGAAGHRLRDGAAMPASAETVRVPIAIVGGGIAGLSAAWELERRGMRDFVVLELERAAGGNARSGANAVSAYPWAAHYVPVPDPKATLVRELFTELGVLRDGVWDERALCFSPQERLFMYGQWHAGIEPDFALDAAGRAQFARFEALIAERRASGEFTIPSSRGKRSSPLDTMSMSTWLASNGLTAPELRWYVDYACRDDFGALARDTSAWAGVHYFAARPHDEPGPLTWPEGNGWILKRLLAKLGAYVRAGEPAYRVERAGTGWRVLTPRAAYLCDAVIFAAPTFLAPHVIGELAGRRSSFTYSSWLTANLTLDRLPAERSGRGAPLSWDNVLYDSPALGYVVATHQSLRTFEERSVWTYYWSLAEHAPADARRLLLARGWHEWTELILADLERAHPDLRGCVSRIDVMRMGHAMPRPTPGFLLAPERTGAWSLPRLYFAHSDMSGLALFEEAQDHGVTAARRAMAVVGRA